ncbi:MAG: hypothetical protein ABIE36_01370 [Candidatus Diapherotrites archaeon]
MEKLKDLIGKKVILGFGNTNERLVLLSGNNGGTFYASNRGIEITEREKITTEITPTGGVVCEEVGYIKNSSLFFKLGRNRFLTATYYNDDKGINLRVAYSPDEQDLEYQTSEFLNKCEGRGLI